MTAVSPPLGAPDTVVLTAGVALGVVMVFLHAFCTGVEGCIWHVGVSFAWHPFASERCELRATGGGTGTLDWDFGSAGDWAGTLGLWIGEITRLASLNLVERTPY